MYRILAVDDDDMMLRLLQRTLKSEGFEVLTCNLGGDAVARALADKPDLIILDVNLADIHGSEACRRLKAEPKTRHIPVLMLTGEARDVEERVKGLDVGADDYLFKPISISFLAARIGAILQVTTKPSR